MEADHMTTPPKNGRGAPPVSVALLHGAHPADAADIDAFADRDREPVRDISQPPSSTRKFWRCPELVTPILQTAELPWIELRLAENGPPIVRGRSGAYVILIGWEGSGKSSLVLQLGVAAARSGAAFVYLTTELDAEEAAARVIGIETGESWENVQRGRVPREAMEKAAAMPGFIVLAEENATLKNLEDTVNALRKEDTRRPIVLAVDYLQDIDFEGRDERTRTRGVSRAVRRLAKRLRAFTLAVSQTSRVGREDLRSGEALGAETVTKGAESSQLERDAYVTLALGNPRENADGTTSMDLSVGKGRMTRGNQVQPVTYDGRSGRWSLAGESRSAVEVRAERANARAETKVVGALDRIVGELDRAAAPMTPNKLREAINGNRDIVYAAASRLREGAHRGVVQVVVKGKSGVHLWSRAKAEAAGLPIVPVVSRPVPSSGTPVPETPVHVSQVPIGRDTVEDGSETTTCPETENPSASHAGWSSLDPWGALR
jgi:KaiC/GvpD/RAD55 family RecA-like ATPase